MISDLDERVEAKTDTSNPNVLFFVGPPGAGKTTMIAHMTDILDKKKTTPMLNLPKHRALSRGIAELTEELEELRSEKKQLLGPDMSW